MPLVGLIPKFLKRGLVKAIAEQEPAFTSISLRCRGRPAITSVHCEGNMRLPVRQAELITAPKNASPRGYRRMLPSLLSASVTLAQHDVHLVRRPSNMGTESLANEAVRQVCEHAGCQDGDNCALKRDKRVPEL